MSKRASYCSLSVFNQFMKSDMRNFYTLTFSKSKPTLWIFILLLFLSACRTSQQSSSDAEDIVKLTFLHINDVYEIGGVSGGKYGNLARVAQLKQELLKENPNTYLVLPGDFLNPSVFGTLKLNGERIAGEQMVDVMNAAQVDFVTFGNHEFDLKENQVLERINESEFEWVASNTFYFKDGKQQPFKRKGKELPTYLIIEPKNTKGEAIKVGVLGITTQYTQPSFVRYTDEYETAKKLHEEIKPNTDFTVILTHLYEDEDKKLAELVPEVKLLMGGHDHENTRRVFGKTILAKADANAKTAYIHRLTYNKKTQELNIESELKTIDKSIKYEPITKAAIEKWDNIADSVFEAQGFNPDRKIYNITKPMDATEVMIRNYPTSAGILVTNAMANAFPDADIAVLGSGSIRIDDVMMGTMTEYDVLRMLPFGGKIYQFEASGELLIRFLDAGLLNKGSGGYLQYQEKLSYQDEKGWLLNEKPIEKDKVYKIVTNDYNLTGKETNMGFMNKDTNKEIKNVISSNDPNSPQSDIRKAVIVYLEKL